MGGMLPWIYQLDQLNLGDDNTDDDAMVIMLTWAV